MEVLLALIDGVKLSAHSDEAKYLLSRQCSIAHNAHRFVVIWGKIEQIN
jgi:hypothetical protein